MEPDMPTIPTSSPDQLYDQWLEHAEAVFTGVFPADSTGPLPTLDGLERRTAQLAQDTAHWLPAHRHQDQAEPGGPGPLRM